MINSQTWLQKLTQNAVENTKLLTSLATAIRPKHKTANKSGYSSQTQTPNSQQDSYSNQTQTQNCQQVWLQQSDPNTKLPTSLATAIRPKHQTANKSGYSNQTQTPNCQQVWLQQSDPNTKLPTSLATAIRPKHQTANKSGYSNQTQTSNCQQVWLQQSDPNTKLLRSLTCGWATTGGQWVSRVQVGCELLHAEHLADVARVHIWVMAPHVPHLLLPRVPPPDQLEGRLPLGTCHHCCGCGANVRAGSRHPPTQVKVVHGAGSEASKGFASQRGGQPQLGGGAV